MKIDFIPGDCVVYWYDDGATIFSDPYNNGGPSFTLFFDYVEQEFSELGEAQARLRCIRKTQMGAE